MWHDIQTPKGEIEISGFVYAGESSLGKFVRPLAGRMVPMSSRVFARLAPST